MFFKVWENHGLEQVPRIELIETKQIIPDKHLFGDSNFAENAFNVVIQLGTKASPGRNHFTKQRNQTESNTQENLDVMSTTDTPRHGSHDVVNPNNTIDKSGEKGKNTEDSYSDDSVNHVTSGGNVAAGESVAEAVEDHAHVSGVNRKRKNTNTMEEGHNVIPGGDNQTDA